MSMLHGVRILLMNICLGMLLNMRHYSYHGRMIASCKYVLTIWSDLHALTCGGELKVLNQLKAPKIIIILSQRCFFVFR